MMPTSAARMFKAIEESRSLEKILIDNADEALYFYSMEGELIYVSPAFEDITGFSTQELHEKNFIPFVHPDDLEWTMKLWEGLYRGELFENVEYRIVKMNGETSWCISTWRIVCDHDGTQIGIQGKQRDITKRKQAEEELQTAKRHAENLARTDDLTALNNRRSFFEQGNTVLRLAQRYDHPMSVAMMDIDKFKSINDTHGHSVGDNAIKTIANIILQTVRKADIVARLGGDEFAVIMPETNLAGSLSLMERIRQEIALTTINVGKNSPIHITVSTGISSCPVKNETVESLLSKADSAMYRAKKEIAISL